MTNTEEHTQGPTTRRSRFVALLVLACIALIAIDAGLLLRVRHLERRVAELTRIAERADRPRLTEGDRFPTVTLLDTEGRTVRLTGPLEQEPTLLLVSSQGCDYCRVVKALWNEAAAVARGRGIRVLGLVLDATPDALAKEDESYPVLAPGDDAWSLIDQIPGVPGAILIRPDGVVARAFYGADQVGLTDAVETFTPSP